MATLHELEALKCDGRLIPNFHKVLRIVFDSVLVYIRPIVMVLSENGVLYYISGGRCLEDTNSNRKSTDRSADRGAFGI